MKKMKKVLAVLLSVCMAVGVFGSIAMATTVSSTEYHIDGSYTVTETTTDTYTDPVTGGTVVYIEIVKSTYDVNDNLISRVTDGESHTSYEPEQDLPPVTVPLVPGTETSGNVAPEDANKTEGPIDNIPSTPDNYDTTTTTSSYDRDVTVKTGDVELTVETSQATMGSVGPELDPLRNEDGSIMTDADGNPIYEDKEGINDSTFNHTFDGIGDPSTWNFPDGADVRYVGYGEQGKYRAVAGIIKYEKNEDGSLKTDENGKPYFSIINPNNGEPFAYRADYAAGEKAEHLTELPEGWAMQLELSSDGTIFKLMDKDGNISYAYCMDLGTPAKQETYYIVKNLEDIDYYASEESTAQIRSIVTNGYWGTSDEPNEDGSYKDGSLASIIERVKEDVAAARESDPNYGKITVYQRLANGRPALDENGERIPLETIDILDVIADLTAGEALLATQAAIWSFSNGSQDAMPSPDEEMGRVLLNLESFYNFSESDQRFTLGEVLDKDGDARTAFLYSWLIGLEDDVEPQIRINEDNNFKDITFTVKDKVEDHEKNLDEKEDNDVYNTELNFQLAFIPGPNDDLIVLLLDAKGDPIRDANDQPITRRLAGTKQEGEEYITEVNGVYTLTGLQLSENSNFTFNIKLKGVQHLEKGVYVYSPVDGRDSSQTFVGMAEGSQDVAVTVGMTITFDVDENNNVVADREWYSKENWNFPPETPNPPPGEYIPDNPPPMSPPPGEPGEEILDEDVPLAGVPNTGDASMNFLYLAIASGAALVALLLVSRKNRKA